MTQTHLDSVRIQAHHLQQWIDDEPRSKGEKLPPSQEHITNPTNEYIATRQKIEEENKAKKEKRKELKDDILVYTGVLYSLLFFFSITNHITLLRA